MNDQEADKLCHLLEEIVEGHWSLYGKAVLASAVGIRLRKEIPEFPTLAPLGLLKFLESHPVVKRVTFPGVPQKIGLVPLRVAIPDEEEGQASLFESGGRDQPGTLLRRQEPGFRDEFWHAFHTPLTSKRFAVVNKEKQIFRLVEGETATSEGEEAFEIGYDDISAPPRETPLVDKIKITRGKISAWLNRNSLAENLFLKPDGFRARPDFPEPRSYTPAMFHQGGLPARSVSPFDKLTSDELARILVPLDLVIKMLRS